MSSYGAFGPVLRDARRPRGDDRYDGDDEEGWEGGGRPAGAAHRRDSTLQLLRPQTHDGNLGPRPRNGTTHASSGVRLREVILE